MDTLSPQRLEQLAAQLASKPDAAIREAIKGYTIDDRLALKLAIDLARTTRGLTAQADEPPGRRPFEQNGEYWCRHLGVDGPTTLKALDEKLSAAGLEASVRIECKTFAMEQGWLSPGLGHRIEAHKDVPLLSVEMAGVFRAAGLDPDASYTPQEVDEALATSQLAVHEKMALRTEMAARHRVTGSDTMGDWQTKVQVLHQRMAALRRLVRG
jgi:hypothetical protein